MSEPVKNEWIDSMLFLMRSNGTSERNDDAGKMYLALEELLERRKCDEEPMIATIPEPEEYNGLMITDKVLDQRFSGVILEQLYNGEYSVVKRPHRQRERI